MIKVEYLPAQGHQAAKLVKYEKMLIFFQKALVGVLSGNAGQVLGDGSQQAECCQAAVYIYPVII